ncbi:MAG: haloacid dehalogenase-like hydrolase [Acidobacteriota bacterium]|nr:haloacid dehalogenase-like hydrolase [Acidobacteriota bacterium]
MPDTPATIEPPSAAAPQILSPEDFQAAVLALSPRTAVFDCDGTLWSGDAGSGFMFWTIDQGLLSREATDWLDRRYRAYKRGEVSELAICGDMVQVYHGLRESEIRAGAAEFFRTRIEPHIFPEMLTLVRELQSRGTDIWTVSSTCNWVIEEGVRRFGVTANRVLAARVSVAEGMVTDILCDVPTDEGKVSSLARAGITAPDAVFGNSIHDAAMLSIARTRNGAPGAFPVNPSPALVTRAAEHNWPVFYPASVRHG